jgi:protein SCO1/2
MKTRYLILGAGLGFILISLIVSFYFGQNYTFRGSLIEPPVPVEDFTLKNYDGDNFQLSQQMGKIVLVFFGYTSCPDVCPTTLAEFKQIQNRLKQHADKVEFVFITVDPDRDTPERIGNYLQSFSPSFWGLTGSQEILDEVYDLFGVYAEKEETGSTSGYLVAHTSRIYVLDQGGRLRLTFAYESPVDSMTEDLLQLLKDTEDE